MGIFPELYNNELDHFEHFEQLTLNLFVLG